MTTTITRIDTGNTAGISLLTDTAVVLDEDMTWTDEYGWSMIIGSATETISGGTHRQSYTRPSQKGRPITLESVDDMGSQKKSTVNKLVAQSEIAGALYKLDIASPGETLGAVVVYRAEDNPVQFKLKYNINELPDNDFYYSGAIMLSMDIWPPV